MPGIEPGAFHMQSERSTTEPHPRRWFLTQFLTLCKLFLHALKFEPFIFHF